MFLQFHYKCNFSDKDVVMQTMKNVRQKCNNILIYGPILKIYKFWRKHEICSIL